jgi:hypothetical protein
MYGGDKWFPDLVGAHGLSHRSCRTCPRLASRSRNEPLDIRTSAESPIPGAGQDCHPQVIIILEIVIGILQAYAHSNTQGIHVFRVIDGYVGNSTLFDKFNSSHPNPPKFIFFPSTTLTCLNFSRQLGMKSNENPINIVLLPLTS